MGFFMARFAILFFIFYGFLCGIESSLDSKDLQKYGDFSSFFTQCKKKDAEGCYHLGLAYLSGFGVLPNENLGDKYLKMACQNDYLQACLALNKDALNNTLQSIELYKKTCNMNNLESCSTLAQILEQNISVNSSNNDKLELLNILYKICKLSADSKCKKASEFKGQYMINDEAQMLSECEAAINEYDSINQKSRANLQVCGSVGDMYANGKLDSNITKDKDKAAYYYSFACKANSVYCYKYELDSILN